MPVTANRAVREIVSKGRAGIRWDSVVDTVWKDIGGNQGDVLSILIEKFGGYKTEVEERIEGRKKLRRSAKK